MTISNKSGVLFDLKNDPSEMNNLAGTNPERFKHQKIAEEMRAKLVGYLNDVNYPLLNDIENRVLIRE